MKLNNIMARLIGGWWDRKINLKLKREEVMCTKEEKLIKAMNDGDLVAVEKLLKNGANPNARYTYEKTPLFYLYGTNRLQKAELLIRYGADVNATDENGDTPLLHSVWEGYEDIGGCPFHS